MVNKKLLLPQEVETYYIIPALRRNLATIMKAKGMKQKDIAAILMVHTAAISQYASAKRGHQVKFNDEIKEEIKKSADKITDRLSYLKETQRLLKVIREKKVLCQVHCQFSELPDNCIPETVGCVE